MPVYRSHVNRLMKYVRNKPGTLATHALSHTKTDKDIIQPMQASGWIEVKRSPRGAALLYPLPLEKALEIPYDADYPPRPNRKPRKFQYFFIHREWVWGFDGIDTIALKKIEDNDDPRANLCEAIVKHSRPDLSDEPTKKPEKRKEGGMIYTEEYTDLDREILDGCRPDAPPPKIEPWNPNMC